ncbi:MAG: sulfite exporter TauE/SafE family protein [Deltaproteobacteria bacterium]|nr:sulfite exporter TauE/SafE family protein [Deltaproteobacteria bacterium]
MDVARYLALAALGTAVGAYGTLIGAGGGFILMPVLLLLYPHQDPAQLASISLAVVFLNALSGSAAYGRMGRIDYRSGLLFAAAAVPGAVLGAIHTSLLPRRIFDVLLGALLVAGAAFLALRPRTAGASRSVGPRRFRLARRIIDAHGTTHEYSVNLPLGLAASAVVGYLSSLLGIGGGIVHVPLLVYALGFPVHVATATSHFVLAVMALSGTLVHVATGAFTQGVHRTIVLGIGVVLGAQVGARLSERMRGRWIIRGLAMALAVVGLRILAAAS